MLPNVWSLFNLQGNPFFQDTLRDADPPTYPLELFVGRQGELRRLLGGLGGGTSSRQIIAGSPGVGKTTLAQKIKEEAARAGYVTHTSSVAVGANDEAGTLLLRVLGNVYEAVLGMLGVDVAEAESMAEARHVVRAFRVRHRSGGASAFGFGAQYGASDSYVAPAAFDALGSAPRILAEIERLACHSHGRRGIIIHLNNFENLAGEKEFQRAAAVLRDLRDIFLLHNFHWLVVGTARALEATLLPHPQVASIFPTPEPLAPLGEDEFADLLARRYEYLRVDSSLDVLKPVSPEAAISIYSLFEGDLRGTLRALQEAAELLIGYGDDRPNRPLEAADVLDALRPRYIAAFQLVASSSLQEQFARLPELDDSPFTQEQLTALWGVTRARVSQILADLRDRGYVREVGRRGPLILYGLTGLSRVMLNAPPSP